MQSKININTNGRRGKWILAGLLLSIAGGACQASVEPELTGAIRQRNLPKVQMLLAKGADVNAQDESE